MLERFKHEAVNLLDELQDIAVDQVGLGTQQDARHLQGRLEDLECGLMRLQSWAAGLRYRIAIGVEM